MVISGRLLTRAVTERDVGSVGGLIFLATKSDHWNGEPRLECVNGRHPPSGTPVSELIWTW